MTATRDSWTVTGAAEVLPADAPRELWLAERRKGLGGSDTSAVFGLNRYTSPLALWLDKTGRFVDESDSDAAAWGRRLEPIVADWFTEETGVKVRRAGLLRSIEHPVLQATPDRLTRDGGVEIKTLEWHTEHEWDDGQTPDHAELQAQKCMAVTGRSHWWVVGLVNGRRPHLRHVKRNPELIDEIVRYETWWWKTYVDADEMPPLDSTAATNDVVRAWMGTAEPETVAPVTDKLLDLYRALAAAKTERDLADARVVGIDSQIRLAIGGASVVALDPDGPVDDSKAGRENVLVTARNDGAFSAKRFTESHPSLAVECMTSVDVLDTARLKREHPAEYGAHRARVVRPRKTLTRLLEATPDRSM